MKSNVIFKTLKNIARLRLVRKLREFLFPEKQAPNTIHVTVLEYHKVGTPPEEIPEKAKLLYVSQQNFDDQMKYLVENKYKSITPRELANIIKKGEEPTQNLVVISFDDGDISNYTTAYPILKRYGLIGVFFVISDNLNIPKEGLKEMSENGMIIDSHSSTHTRLTTIAEKEKLIYEIQNSKESIEKITGKTVYSFCYPYGNYDENVIKIVKESGYEIAFGVKQGKNQSLRDIFCAKRLQATNNMKDYINSLR